MQPIPFQDLRREAALHTSELKAAFARVLESGRYVLGPEVEALEAEWADAVGTRHAVGVSSGSDALLATLMALDVGPGDEVICPTYTFLATASAIARLGATPVFADSERDTLNLDPKSVQQRLTSKTKAILVVHLFGRCAEMNAILALANARGLAVIEDAAQAMGASFGEKKAGNLGHAACFSTYPTKNLGGFGDGGVITTNDANLALRLKRLRVHGANPKYFHPELGGNFRLDELQAALLRVKLPHLERTIAARRKIAALYDTLLSKHQQELVLTPPNSGHAYHQYVVQIPGGKRDQVRALLTHNDIGTEIYYPKPLHLQACFATLGFTEGDFPVAEAASRETLALPIFPGLREEEIESVASHLIFALQQHSVCDEPQTLL